MPLPMLSAGGAVRLGLIDRSTRVVYPRLDAILYACHLRMVIAHLEAAAAVMRFYYVQRLHSPAPGPRGRRGRTPHNRGLGISP